MCFVDATPLVPMKDPRIGTTIAGRYVIESISKRDYVPLQGAVVVIAVTYVLINFAVDMFYAVLDPRIRHARSIA